MPQDLCTHSAPVASSRSLALIAAILLAIVTALAFNAATTETGNGAVRSDLDVSAPVEDWHGNVKRSHWTP